MTEVRNLDPREVLPDGVLIKAIRLASTRPTGLMRQADVAVAMGVSRGRVSQLENAESLRTDVKERYYAAVRAVLEQHPDWRPR